MVAASPYAAKAEVMETEEAFLQRHSDFEIMLRLRIFTSD